MDSQATELSRDDTIVFIRHLMMSTGPDASCTASGGLAPACKPDTCRPCKDRAAAHADLLDLIAHELDELETQLTAESAGEVYEETCHPAEGAWWAYCSQCGTRYQTSRGQSQFCGATCRKAAQRARDRASGITRP